MQLHLFRGSAIVWQGHAVRPVTSLASFAFLLAHPVSCLLILHPVACSTPSLHPLWERRGGWARRVGGRWATATLQVRATFARSTAALAARMHVAAEPQQVPAGRQLGITAAKGSASMPALVLWLCLAERALLPVVPDETEFPYTIRVEVRDISASPASSSVHQAAAAWASRSPCCSVLNTAPNCWHGFIVSVSRSRPSPSPMAPPPWHPSAAAASPCWMRVRALAHLPCTC